jgi:hypothetical protein
LDGDAPLILTTPTQAEIASILALLAPRWPVHVSD